MRWFTNLVAAIARRLRPLGVCANAGLIVGILTGGALSLIDFLEGPLALSLAEALRFWAITALFGWLTLLFIFVALVRWTLSSVALPALLNAVLVSGLTVFLCRALALYGWAWLVGILVGIAIGLLLCRLSRLLARD